MRHHMRQDLREPLAFHHFLDVISNGGVVSYSFVLSVVKVDLCMVYSNTDTLPPHINQRVWKATRLNSNGLLSSV